MTFSGPSGGGVGASAGGDRLGTWMNFAATGTMAVGDWMCDVTDSLATCVIPSIAAGTVETLNLGVVVNGPLATNATTHLTIADAAGYSNDVSVRTGMAPVERNGDLLFAADGNLGTAVAGAASMSCDPSDSGCDHVVDYNGNAVKSEYNNNAWDMKEVNKEGGNRNSASTTLTVPSDATVLAAFLVWSANHGPSDGFTDTTNTARVRPPGAADYITITADTISTWTDPGGRTYYQARADLTSLIQQYGGGTWAVADIAVSDGRTDTNPSYYAGFALTAVYEQAILPKSSVAVYSGADPVTKDDEAEYTFATDGESDVDVSVIAWEGDRGLDGDTLTLDGDKMTPEHTTSGGAISTGDKDNAFDSTAFGSGEANSLGTDAKDFKTETVDAGEHTLVASGDGDNYAVGMVVVQTTPTDDAGSAGTAAHAGDDSSDD